jgi:lipid-binding SYLF domain-containing protein
MKTTHITSIVCFACLLAYADTAFAQAQEEASVVNSINVFNEIMAVPATGIPQALLRDSYAVAIIPNAIKGGFIIGARYGRGVLMVRDNNGGWYAPMFITLVGGNVGYQIGVQSTDVILVFKTKQSVQGLLQGKFTVGADAAVAAGPVGRQAAAATDGRLQAEIYSYSRSRGLFAGVSIDGSVIEINRQANAEYYRSPAPGAPAVVPPAAQQLVSMIAQHAGPNPTATIASSTPAAAGPSFQPAVAHEYSQDEVTAVREELANFAPRLYELLDPKWQNYLALPAEVFSGSGPPAPQALADSLARFQLVQSDPQYRSLAERPEFQTVYGLLKHYEQSLAGEETTISLPAPPPAP